MVKKIASTSARTKLSMIVGLLLCPMAILGYLMATQMQQDIEFVKKELVGIEFSELMVPLLAKMASEQPIQSEMTQFIDRGTSLADELGMRGEFEAFIAFTKSPDALRTDLVRSGQRLAVTAADHSNLVLDPVGESYHLAALSNVYVADMINNLVIVRSELTGQNQQGSGDALIVNNAAFQLGKLSEVATRLHDAALSAASWSSHSKDYNQVVKMAAELAEDPRSFARDVQARVEQTGMQIQSPIMATETEGLLKHVLGETIEVWKITTGKLENILVERVSTLSTNLFHMVAWSSAAAIAALGAAAFMFGSTLGRLDDVEKAYGEADEARRDAEEMSYQLQTVNNDISNLNQELAANVAQLREAQDEIVKKGKMAQLGQLVATVAHELRNPLGAVSTSVFLLERKVKDKPLGIQPQIERIYKGIQRCDSIITQLLDFTRVKQIDAKPASVDDWLAKLIEEESAKLPEEVAIECDLGLGNACAKFDPARLQRAIINLLSNASEAMVGKGGAGVQQVTLNPLIAVSTTLTARGIEIKVTDNGPGMSPEVRERVLEPLFTTKNFGTGLGLPAVEQIADQHGGGLEIESTVGKGSSFTIWIPAHSELEEAA